MNEYIYINNEDYSILDNLFIKSEYKKIFIVCGKFFKSLKIAKYFDEVKAKFKTEFVFFSDFNANPVYESVVYGVKKFNEKKCDTIFAIGGGSAIDVAKCIKLYSNMDDSVNYLKQVIVPNNIKLIAMPTTAGTGSEATKYAVIYYKGEKQSITDISCIPNTVIFDSGVLKYLSLYQKKSTMLDALCHAIESYWSVNSNDESKAYSKKSINIILKYKNAYLANENIANKKMLEAANLAGKAINIAQTTAGHAMCYKISTLYNIAHGHSAAIVDKFLWLYMVANIEKCVDTRGIGYLINVFNELAKYFNCNNMKDGAEKFALLVDSLNLEIPYATDSDFNILNSSVNKIRIKNNPISLDEIAINELYHQILYKKEKKNES